MLEKQRFHEQQMRDAELKREEERLKNKQATTPPALPMQKNGRNMLSGSAKRTTKLWGWFLLGIIQWTAAKLR